MKKLTIVLSIFLAWMMTVPKVDTSTIIADMTVIDTVSMWDVFTRALIMTESAGNPSAVGKTNDVGILQITPIYVKDANRIANSCYTLDDRYDPVKSLEMFAIINSHYNPELDIDKAIKLHNPGAGDWYANRIKQYMEQELSSYVQGATYDNMRIVSVIESDKCLIIKKVLV